MASSASTRPRAPGRCAQTRASTTTRSSPRVRQGQHANPHAAQPVGRAGAGCCGPVRWEDAPEVERERTKAYGRLGHRDRYAPRVQIYAPVAAGGFGATHYYAVGAAALVDQ
eukprot:427486-Prymnesium_polylepis.1